MTSNYCANCGAKISEGSKFCGNCGMPINKPIFEEEEVQKPFLKKESPTVVQAKSVQSKSKKKGGIIRTLGKAVLWIFIIAVLGIIALYFIGDATDNNNREKLSQKDEVRSEVRKANPVLTKTETFHVIPTAKKQIFAHSDDIIVTVPPNFTTKNQSLTISRASVDRSIEFKGATPLALFDVTLDNGKQPPKPVDISVSYNPDELDPNSSPEEQLTALRWDEERGIWVNLPVSVDTKNHTVSALADHFTLFEWVIIAAVVNAIKQGTDGGEILLNDAYLTPEKNFRILYSKKEINNRVVLGDREWKNLYSGSGIKYDKNHPRYIQDMGYFLEKSLSTYTKKYKFKNPAGKKKSWFKSYQKTIIVKLDSYMAQLSGDPYYEKLFERIHLPISYVLEPSGAKTTTAHELFHVIQGEYYGKLGLARATSPYRLWWLEATAEYAAHDIAWPHYSKEMTNGIGSNYLNFSIDSKGSKAGHGWGDSPYEYKTSIWIKYLVDNGAVLKEMIENDASDYHLSITSLENYWSENKKSVMDDAYRKFANWMVFSKDGALHKFPIASFGISNNSIAIKENKLELGSGKEVNYTFNMPDHYTSKLWAIEITEKEKDSIEPDFDFSFLDKKSILIKVNKKSPGSVVDVFIIPKNLRNPSSLKPVTSIFTKNTSKLLNVNVGDLVCITTTQGSSTNGNAEVVVSDAGIILEIDPPELSDVRPREANYFTITAKNIPKEIKKVLFEWDYNDGSEKGIHDFVTVSEGEAKQKISHRYKESDKEEIYPLKVILKDANRNMVLAEAEASVTMPLAKPQLVITPRQAIGAPGTTFDFEATVIPKNTYKFQWEIEGKTFDQIGEKSRSATKINEKGTYKVSVKLYDVDNNFLVEDHASIVVEEQQKNIIERIDVTLEGYVELKFIPDDGEIGRYPLSSLNKIHFTNDGHYVINGMPYQMNISIHGDKVFGLFVEEYEKYKSKNEIVLFFDKFTTRKLVGFQYKNNTSSGDDSKSSKTISVKDVPFKLETSQGYNGETLYMYRYKGNIVPYIVSCEMKDLSTNRNGTSGSKWGNFEPNWEIYVGVTFK